MSHPCGAMVVYSEGMLSLQWMEVVIAQGLVHGEPSNTGSFRKGLHWKASFNMGKSSSEHLVDKPALLKRHK